MVVDGWEGVVEEGVKEAVSRTGSECASLGRSGGYAGRGRQTRVRRQSRAPLHKLAWSGMMGVMEMESGRTEGGVEGDVAEEGKVCPGTEA